MVFVGLLLFYIFAIIKHLVMSEEQNKSEKEVVPNPEGYTLVKYSYITVFIGIVIFGILFLLFVGFLQGDDGKWLVEPWLWWLLAIIFPISGWLITHKLTEAKVNIKLTDKGLEQTRLSGSRFVPKYRNIPWSNMNRVFFYGRNQSVNFLICVDEGVNLRISMPVIRVFERQKANDDVLEQLREEFKEMGILHGLIPYGASPNILKRT
jgi:hypothetical protein